MPEAHSTAAPLRALFALAVLGLLGSCAEEVPPVLFISLPAADAVDRVDPRTGEVLSHTVVGKLPHSLLASADGTRVYVSLSGSQAVAELDARTGALLRTFLTAPVPTVRQDGTPIEEHAAQDAASHTTCFGCHGGGGQARTGIVGTRPYALALSADGTRLYVTNIEGGSLARIRLDTGEREALVPLAPTGEAHKPTGLARLGDTLFVSLLPTLPSSAPAVVRRLGAEGQEALGEVATGANAGELHADAARGEVDVSNFETNTITRLSAAGAHLATFTVGNGPLGTLRTPDGALLVANYYDNSVSRVEPASGEVRTVHLEQDGKPLVNPTHLVLHGGALYALSSGTAGHLLTLDPRSLALTHAVKVAGLPFDLLAAPREK